MNVPDRVRESLRTELWRVADSLNWVHLSSAEKSRHYEQWTQSSDVGGILAQYLGKGRVRVYLKDTLLKDYTRRRFASADRPLTAIGLGVDVNVIESYIKPHGRRLADGRVVSWGRAEDWKTIITATFERSYTSPGSEAFAAVLLDSVGRWDEPAVHAMVEEAARRLGLSRVVWLGP